MYHLYFFISQSATASWSEPLSSVRSFPSPLQDISPDFHPPLTSTPSCSSANLSEKSRMETQQVRLSVQYPSKSLNKNVGKALAHGVPSRIATAVMNCLPVRNQSFSRLLLLLLLLSLLLIFCCSKSTEKQNCFFFFSNADWNAVSYSFLLSRLSSADSTSWRLQTQTAKLWELWIFWVKTMTAI